MTPDSPAGRAAAELARRIRALNDGTGDTDPDTLATRYLADLVARGWRQTRAARGPDLGQYDHGGTSHAHEHADAIRAALPRPGGSDG